MPVSACPTTAIQYHRVGGVASVIPGNDDRKQRRPPRAVKKAPTYKPVLSPRFETITVARMQQGIPRP